jgi:protein TonB
MTSCCGGDHALAQMAARVVNASDYHLHCRERFDEVTKISTAPARNTPLPAVAAKLHDADRSRRPERQEWRQAGAPAQVDAGSRAGIAARLHLQPRQGLLLVVLALHAGLVALLLMQRNHQQLPIDVPAIEAQVMADAASKPEAAPLPQPAMERPHIDAITPDVQVMLPAPDAPTAAPATPAPVGISDAPATAAPEPPEPVTPPRFDAKYLKNPAPLYPAASRRSREEGTVLMRVRVSPQGAALEVLLEKTSGSQRLDDAAMVAVRQWRFVAAQRAGKPVEAWVLVPIEFALHHW